MGLYEVQLIGPKLNSATNVIGGEQTPLYDLYQCIQIEALSSYIGRLFIHWGDSSSARRAWVQRADSQDKEIVELTREFKEEAFPGFTKLIRPLSEIETMPRLWKEMLRESRGVYLLACPRTREHYVGSASGQDGFLGRWRDYVANSHGGNVALRNRDPSDYLVSVLEVAASSATSQDIINLETTWKLKLHSRDIGLTRN